ncbi:hypothetical protein H074_38608 [Amycolatopsis decaplanina DSM 44594]|uniref:Uncharacterized protein n=1 Tax=Amycolatopsis decaplanina DSM 44594 TaxID=1284240 RepID=M2YQ84_9PSEU|nr:hypothetical protein H074_38608 [Amycolatopsis decaplanina DSM 44594]
MLYSATSSTTSSTPAFLKFASNRWRVGDPPNRRPSTNGSTATTRAPAVRAARASTIVERPW